MQATASKVFVIIPNIAFVFFANSSYAADMTSEPEKPVTEQLVDTLTLLAHGPYAGFRANHAKGIITSGTFTPVPGAAA